MRVSRFSFCVSLVFALTAFHPAAGAEDPSPQAVVRRYLEAARDGQLKAARDCIQADGKDEAALADCFAALMVDSQRLLAAARAKFGKGVDRSGIAKYAKEHRAYVEATLKRLAATEVIVRDDTATLTLPKRDEKRESFNLIELNIVLKKVGGDWKIDLKRTFPLANPAEDVKDPYFVVMRDRVAVIAKFITAIEQGRFKSFEEFDRLYEDWATLEIKDPFAPQKGEK